ncbi:MAG: UDP-glucose 4-epimerase [Rickettsiales bacterium]|jgi:UDP-glucose 4-epimerase
MNNVLVTGGAGYIGSHTCKKLFESGYNPVIIDNFSTGNKEHVLWGDLEVGDLCDIEFIKNVLRKYKPLGVIHFAASSVVSESMVNPYKYYRNNTCNSLNLLQAMVDCDVDKIIFSSTCAIFGIPKNKFIDELCKKQPLSTYGRSKLMIEDMLHDYDNIHSIKSVSLRYFNACGASKCGKIGEKHDPETHLIPLVIEAALGKRDHVKIFGNDYPTKDGTCVRDYVHVDDLADAHLKSLEYLIKNNTSNQFNIGNGQGFSVREIVTSVSKILNTKFDIREVDRRAGDPPSLIANNKKIKEVLNWEVSYKDIDQIVESAVNWHNSQM